jgi:hypothetical protein
MSAHWFFGEWDISCKDGDDGVCAPSAGRVEERRKNGWRVKIRDDERVEPPHVTIIRKTRAWRLGLRTGEFLDREPPSREVPDNFRELVWENVVQLRTKWDEMYPENPVFSQEDEG